MTFARLTRGLSLGALAATIVLPSAMAQNGTNYHCLTNDGDVFYSGIGAGGTSTALDGVMTHIPGEELKGSHIYPFSGDFGYRQSAFREVVCLQTPPPVGPYGLNFPGVVFLELDGRNGNDPDVMTNPACALPSFPTSGSFFMPYGTGPGTTFSFLLAGLPSGAFTILGVASPCVALLPDNGLISAGAGGTATLIGGGSGFLGIPTVSAGNCWAVQFTWGGTALGSFDDVDGWVHWTMNSPDNNQYWVFSNDELNIWQSRTVLTDAGQSALFVLPASTDYNFLMATVEPNTHASLAPVGVNASGPYYTQTDNVQNEFGVPALNLNGGFDVGTGSRVLSLGGGAGVPNPVTSLGNQNPGTSGFLPALGFFTWDNGGDFNGSVRLTWVSIDFLGLAKGNPDTDVGIIKPFYQVRIPVVSAGLTQGLTSLCWGLFGHKTDGTPAMGDPGGLAPGAFGVPPIAGASAQFPTVGLTVCSTPGLLGLPVNLTYGTSGRKDGPGGLTFNPSIADLSGSKELFLFD